MTEIIRKKVLPLILTLALAISLLPAVTPTAGAVDGVTATISPASDLTEENLDTNSLTVTLSGTTFADSTLDESHFTLNNAPTGVTVESVVYIDEASCRVYLAYDGTNFDSDVTDFSLTIASLELSYVFIEDLTSNELTITATRTKLATPENLAWDTTIQAKATWDAVDNASGYSVQLFKRETASGDAVTTTDTSYDFTSALTGTAWYYFTVTALGGETTYSDSDTSDKSAGYSYTQLFTPSGIAWDKTIPAKATWGAVSYASGGYSVQLYKSGTASGDAVTTANTYYDFTELITETGYYKFKVTALGDGSTYHDSDQSLSSDTYHYIAPATQLSTPTNLVWDDATPGKAKWDAVTNASRYSVQIYKDGAQYNAEFGSSATVTNTYYDFTSVITATGEYTFKVTALGDGTVYSESEESGASASYSYTAPEKLSTPTNLAWDDETPAKATWDAVPNASGYAVQLFKGVADIGGSVKVTDACCDFTSAITETGAYTFTVMALSDGTEYANSPESGKSESAYSYVAPLSTPTNLVWDDTVPAKAAWDAVTNASSYSVQLYKGGAAAGLAVTTTDAYYDFTSALSGTGEYTFTVTALGDGTSYADSEESGASASYSYTQLLAPTNLVWDDEAPGKATWDAVEHARVYSGYFVQLYKDGAQCTGFGSSATVTYTYYDFTALIKVTGEYTFKVTALGDEDYADSDQSQASAVYSYTVPSTDASLTSVLTKTDSTPGSQTGADASDAIAWEVSVSNSVSSLSLSDIIAATGASKSLYSDSDFSAEITGSDAITLTAGSTTTVYIKVTAEDAATVLYYAVAITRASSGGDGGSGGSAASSNTITSAETSSGLFSSCAGSVMVKADMQNAFSTSVDLNITDSEEAAANFGFGIGNTVYPFNISLCIKGTDTETEPKDGYAVTLYLPIPDDLLDVKEQISIAHMSDDGSVTTLDSQLKQIDGAWYLVVEATEFSPFALVVSNAGSYNEADGLPYYVDSDGDETFLGFAANGTYVAPDGVTVLTRENTKSFTDTAGHWAADYIDFVTERELFLGTGNDTFSPDSGMTRAMFATVIGRLYERSFGEIEAANTHVFTDCDYDDYYGKYVDWAAGNGILGGYGNGTFGPDDPVTREQMAAILYRFADFLGVLSDDIDTALSYPDADSISSWARNAALYCQSAGIITGRDGENFVPQGTATRAEVAVILERFIENALD